MAGKYAEKSVLKMSCQSQFHCPIFNLKYDLFLLIYSIPFWLGHAHFFCQLFKLKKGAWNSPASHAGINQLSFFWDTVLCKGSPFDLWCPKMTFHLHQWLWVYDQWQLPFLGYSEMGQKKQGVVGDPLPIPANTERLTNVLKTSKTFWKRS